MKVLSAIFASLRFYESFLHLLPTGRPLTQAVLTLRALRLCGIFFLLAFATSAQIPAPKDVLGFTPGDDRKLASWAQVVDYFKKLDASSDRMILQEIGKTTMGAPFVYATISSPENLKKLERYKQINAKLADPRTFKSNDREAKKLISEGKTIVLNTFGIHSTEVGSTLSSMLIAHRLASSNEPEIKKILDNTIILLVPSLNPDGVDIVKNWYDKTLGTPYEGTTPPELYHKYVGHDNNRDWYAFTQVETQLTVDKIHNVWHPQIVHDVHQQGANGARLFLPPYMQPVEPNVPKQIVEGFTELGNRMANDLRVKGLEGITTNTTYDAWTPARAYSHYHGGVRILSETASARLATPITVKFEDLRGASGGLDAKKESPNFGPVWKGGEWKLRNITDYMTAAAFSLFNHAADNRERWLSRFYEIGKEAVRPRTGGELSGFILPPRNDRKTSFVLDILARAGVETEEVNEFTLQGRKYPKHSSVVRLAQPYGLFAKALLEIQEYPNLRDESGNPINPYDVTAHTMSLLTGVEVTPITSIPRIIRTKTALLFSPSDVGCIASTHMIQLYRTPAASMDEGWTRWIIEDSTNGLRNRYFPPCDRFSYETIGNNEIRRGQIKANVSNRAISTEIRPGSILFPDQPANQILNGHAKGSMPDEYTGGVGKEGVENLKKFVEDGGTLVFLNRASLFAIEQFNLPIKNVTAGLNRREFFIPGSILRTELDINHPIARNMPRESIAWFENSPAFEMTGGREIIPASSRSTSSANDSEISYRIVARYPSDPKQILLSGWALGADKIAGKAALVEVTMGKGKIILFGFRPQYRGQSLATFPLLFNAISQ